MEKEQEKQTIYESLVELTDRAEAPNIYFSKYDILENIKANIEADKGALIKYKRKVLKYVGEDNFEEEKLDEATLPRKKTLILSLEELSKEGKLDTIVISDGISGSPLNHKYYRAKKFSRSL